MEYDKYAVLEAWKKAVNHGVIDSSKLRPEIARSWARCMSYEVDPWSPEFPKPDDKLLELMRKKHAAVMAAASPVLQYLLTVYNCNCSLSDMHGFVFDLVTPLSSYPRTLGTFVTEPLNGSGNLTIALAERKPCRVDGYEHYRAIAQNYSGLAAIIDGVNGEDYILCMNDPFQMFPENALDVCIAATKLVKMLSVSRREAFSHLSSATFFDPVLANDSVAIIVTDSEGMILTANNGGKKAITGYEKYPYASRSLCEYLRTKSMLSRLLDDSSVPTPGEVIAFKGGRAGVSELKFIRKRTIDLVTGVKHHVLVFETASEHETVPQPSSVRRGAPVIDCIGDSPQWHKVMDVIESVSVHSSNVMIMGETGTGKEVAARALHRMSGRSGEFVAINCGALPRDLLASELFGYEGGAFTGARSSGAKGKFEYANGGTLFLDEIGDMPIDMQVSLLRVLQEQSVTRIGANKAIPINVRVIAATNQDLQKLISEGKFRSDLWYRLSVIEIYLPRLCDRDGDVPLLAEYFNRTLSQELNISYHPLSDRVMQFLCNYNWPGNVRELKNVMEKALIISRGAPLTVDNFPYYVDLRSVADNESNKELYSAPVYNTGVPILTSSEKTESRPAASPPLTGRQLREQMEKEKIIKVLEEERGNISRSAARLGISRNTLYRKLERLDIQLKVKAVSEQD